MRIVVMGVSGCGKSSFGAALGAALGLRYIDGDDLHPAANVAKMEAGTPLTDEDRAPWLDRVAEVLAKEAPVIVGCSALKRRYRDRLRQAGDVLFLHLAGSPELILARMKARAGHFMPPALLASQFAALEAPGPDEALTLDIAKPLSDLVAEACADPRIVPQRP
jgi:gluconokinase